MTVDPIRLGSASEFLEFRDPHGRPGEGIAVLMARVVGAGIDARAGVSIASDVTHLLAFFAGMQEDWRGWAGERRFQSVEDELTLSARHAGRHIVLRVSLAPDAYPEQGWSCEFPLVVEPGEQLARFVRDLRDFLNADVGRPN